MFPPVLKNTFIPSLALATVWTPPPCLPLKSIVVSEVVASKVAKLYSLALAKLNKYAVKLKAEPLAVPVY